MMGISCMALGQYPPLSASSVLCECDSVGCRSSVSFLCAFLDLVRIVHIPGFVMIPYLDCAS